MSTNVLDQLRRFDAYPKTLEDFSVKTFGGAAVTIISAIVISLLFMSELNAYLTPNISEELFVDTSRGPKLKINLDIVVPGISCDYLVLDAMDLSGEQHLHIDHNIYKRKLDLEGRPIEEPKKEEIMTTKKPAENKTSEVPVCGSCYGANFNETQCCNTCEEVKEAYRVRKWKISDLAKYEQCKNSKESDSVNKVFKEGCQIYGYMEVNRVGGSFHIAPGQSFSINHVHVHDIQPFSSTSFNTSHTIRHLSFGTSIQSAKTNPLDGTHVIAEEGATMFQYYIKIVPTMYVKKNGSILQTNQFSVTRHQKSLSILTGGSGMPGVFFSYELSPLMVKYAEKENSLGHFATNVCAIIGGVFTVAGLFDSLLYHSVKAIQKKIEIGKFS